MIMKNVCWFFWLIFLRAAFMLIYCWFDPSCLFFLCRVLEKDGTTFCEKMHICLHITTYDIHLENLRQSLRETVVFFARNAGLSIQIAILPIYFSVCLPVCLAVYVSVCGSGSGSGSCSVLSSICWLYIYISKHELYTLRIILQRSD